MKKRIEKRKLELRKETLARLVVGGLVDETTIVETVYSRRPGCVPFSTHCESYEECTATIA